MDAKALTPDKRRRLMQLIESATLAFAAQGYRRTTMADIARRMGVAPGTVYLYAESKEALFDFLVRWHLGRVDLDSPISLPVQSTEGEGGLELISEQLKVDQLFPALARALTIEHPPDPAAEVRGLVGELYKTIKRYRRFISLIEGSALDWPEMADAFYRFFRQSLFDQLAAYIGLRISYGYLPAVTSESIAARLLMEAIAWFAMHRYGDRYTPDWEEAAVESTLTEMLVRAAGPAITSPEGTGKGQGHERP